MILYCDADKCENCRHGTCQLPSLTLYDGQCEEYEDITEGPDYQERYFIACEYKPKDCKPGESIRYRKLKKGKRVVREGVVFFTNDDIRDGLNGAELTEARTGMLIQGEHIENAEAMRIILKMREEMPPITAYPWMDEQHDAPPVPHKAGADGQEV